MSVTLAGCAVLFGAVSVASAPCMVVVVVRGCWLRHALHRMDRLRCAFVVSQRKKKQSQAGVCVLCVV